MTRLLEDALRKVGKLSDDEQNGIASQILETLKDEEAWGKTLRKNPAKLRKLAEKALDEHRRGKTRPLDEILRSSRAPRASSGRRSVYCPMTSAGRHNAPTGCSAPTHAIPVCASRKWMRRATSIRCGLGWVTARSASWKAQPSSGSGSARTPNATVCFADHA